MPKLSKKKVRFIRNNKGILSIREMAIKLGLNTSDVRDVLKGLKAKGGPGEIQTTGAHSAYGSIIYFTFCVLLLISPLIYYPHIQNFSNLPKATFIQIISCLLMIFWLLDSRSRGRIEIVKHPLMIPLGLWLLWSGITILWSADKLSGVILWIHWFACFLCFFVFINSITDLKRLDTIILYCVASAVIISIIGILQFTLGLDIIPQGYKPGSTFSSRNMAVQFILLIWPFSLLMFFLNRSRKKDWIYLLAHSLIATYLLYTRTRAGWVAAFLTLIALIIFFLATGFWKNLKPFFPLSKIIYFIISIIFIIGMSKIPQYTTKSKATQRGYLETVTSVFEYGEDETTKAKSLLVLSSLTRLSMWINTISIVRDYPFKGVGLSGWRIYYPLYQRAAREDPYFSDEKQPSFTHNEPLQFLAETSVFGLLLYASIFLTIIFRSFTAFRAVEDAGVKLRLIFGMCAALTFTINSFFSFPLHMAIPPLYLMIAMGLLVSLDLRATKSISKYEFQFKDYYIKGLLIVISLFTLLLIIFNYRLILADYRYLRSTYFNRIKNWNLARLEARKAVGYIPWRHRLWFELGKATDHLGLDDEAIDAYLNALRVHPNHLNSLLNLGHVYMIKGDFDKALIHTEKALNIKPDFDKVLYNMGIIKEEKDLEDEAIKYYQETIALNPRYSEAYFRLGQVYLEKELFIEAKEAFEKILEYETGLKGVHFYLGIIYDKLNMYEKARSEYEMEIAINPESAESYTNLGLIQSQDKKWEEAISYYKKAIEINPKLGPAHINLAVAYYMLGEYDSSWKHGKIAQELGMPQAETLIQELEKVSSK